jgi:tetratricopeptide (TPR) repeat protein
MQGGGPPVIDLDRMEADLSAALTAEVRPRLAPRTARPAPAPTLAPAPPPPAPSRQRKSRPPAAPVGVIELMELGLVEEADARIAAATDRLDQTTWATMRALLDGRRDAVRMGLDSLARLAQEGVVAALDRAWVLRFWVALEWGTQDERFDALDHCRERAYRFDELAWWGNLTLLLAVMGKQDEAVRAFDQALPRAGSAPLGPDRLDAVTNLIEAAALLGDAGRVAAAGRHLRTETGRLVVVGAGVACKGSVDRYLGLLHAAVGQGHQAAEYFRNAEATHRALGAAPLLARTLHQARGVPAAA